MSTIPRYAIIGRRPVQMIETPEAGLQVLAFDWETGDFVEEKRYFDRILDDTDVEVYIVDEEKFKKRVALLRDKIASRRSTE
jgi:hypothetical protein